MSPDELAQSWNNITPKLFGYLVNVLRDKATAEDILQSTWMKALDALPRFRPRGAGLSAWLFAIARNECKQHWRHENREVPLNPEIHDIPDHPSESLQDSILIDQIFATMTEDDRELLRLRYITDLPLNDIARILDINFVTVRVRIHRALTRARTLAIANTHHA